MSSHVRRMQDLGARDWLALLAVGPLLGWWLVTSVTGSHNSFVASHGWAVILLGLAGIGVVLGVISPRLRGFAGVGVMIPVIVAAIGDYFEQPAKNNMIGGAIAIYVWFTGFTVFSGYAVTDYLRIVGERRRARPS